MLIAAVTAAAPVAAHQGLTAGEISLIVAGVSLLGIIISASLAAFFGRWAEATNRRRAQYADAMATLVAWAEYPYRIRRRTSDDPAELARLADLGHDVQEKMRCHETWIATESAICAKAYRQVRTRITSQTGPAARDAWTHPPVIQPAHMNLNGWGPIEPTAELDLLQQVISTRFGYRRLIPFSTLWTAKKLSNRALSVAPAQPAAVAVPAEVPRRGVANTAPHRRRLVPTTRPSNRDQP